MILKTHIILYVKNQAESTTFYSKILEKEPTLYVEGMTEFQLSESTVLGLMPTKSIAKIIGNKLAQPTSDCQIAKCELYLYVENIEQKFQIVLDSGAELISEIQIRNWGDKACYFSDSDRNIIAFAEKL